MTSRGGRPTLIAPPQHTTTNTAHHIQSQPSQQPQPHKPNKSHVIPTCPTVGGGGTTTSTTTTPSSQTTTRPTPSSGSSSQRRDISKTVSATKNLRAISLSLVQKLRCAPRGIPSTEIANQLAKEAVRQVVGTDTYVSSKELIAVEKNIRRRLYDSLKVLVSIGAIQRSRTNKMLHWQGVTHLLPPAFIQQQSASSTTELVPMTEKTFQKQKDLMSVLDKTRARLDQKAIMLQQLMQQKVALERLCKRNKKICANDRMVVPHASKIFLPFVVVRTPYHTKINLTSTNDARSMTFTFSENFEIVNDAGILDRLFCVDAPPIDQPSATPSPSSHRRAQSQSQSERQPPPPPSQQQQQPDSQLPQSQSASMLTPHSANTTNPTLISHAPHSLPSSSSIPIPTPTPPPPSSSAPASSTKPIIPPSSSHPYTHVLPHSHPSHQSVHHSPPNSPQQLRRMRYDASGDHDQSPSFQSPKRIRLATVSASPFAKYTSGEKPPLSPGTPLVRRRARRLQRRVSESACASPPAPLSSSVAQHPPLPPPPPRPPPPSSHTLSAPSASSALPPPSAAQPTVSVSDTHSSSSPRPPQQQQVIPPAHDSIPSPSLPPTVAIQPPTLSISDPFPLHLQPHPHSQPESPLQGSTIPPQLSDAAAATWSDPTHQNMTTTAPPNADTSFKEAVATNTRRLYAGAADVSANANVHVADHPVEGLVDDELVGSPMVTPKNWGLSVNGVKSCSAIDGRDLEARQLFINE